MDIAFLQRKDIGLAPFIGSFLLTIFLFKLSSLLAQFGLYFHWSSLFEEQNENYNLWIALVVRFLIPSVVGFVFGVYLPLDCRASVTTGVLFSSLFLVWPALLYFDMVVDAGLAEFKSIFFIFYTLYLIFFPLAAYGGFSLGALLSPSMPRFSLVPGETIKISIGRHILLPAAISLSGNLVANAVLRDFALRVLTNQIK